MVYEERPWRLITSKLAKKVGIEKAKEGIDLGPTFKIDDELSMLKVALSSDIVLLFMYEPRCLPYKNVDIFLQLARYHGIGLLFHVYYLPRRGELPVYAVLLSEGKTLYEALDEAVRTWSSKAPRWWNSNMCNPVENLKYKVINFVNGLIGLPK